MNSSPIAGAEPGHTSLDAGSFHSVWQSGLKPRRSREPAPHGEPGGLVEELEPYLVSVVSTELWKPWANDAESFERAVLADLERRVSKPVAAYHMREPAGRGFREARLDGSYPKTAIVVSFLNLHTGSVEESRFPLWEEEGYRSGDRVIDPESIAADIWTWLIEPL